MCVCVCVCVCVSKQTFFYWCIRYQGVAFYTFESF